ncbi:hypothetical protein HN873_010702 [Arachis hypogaea]
MEFNSFSWAINSIEYPTVPQDFYFSDFFSIMFSLTKELIQITPSTNQTSPLSLTFLLLQLLLSMKRSWFPSMSCVTEKTPHSYMKSSLQCLYLLRYWTKFYLSWAEPQEQF